MVHILRGASPRIICDETDAQQKNGEICRGKGVEAEKVIVEALPSNYWDPIMNSLEISDCNVIDKLACRSYDAVDLMMK